MIKSDEKSLEYLSFEFDERDLANLAHLIDFLKRKNLSTLPDEAITQALGAIEKIGKLKLEGKVYGFHVEDDYAYRQGDDAGHGVELYKRQGNTLRAFFINGDRDWVLKPDQTIRKLKESKISTIYTGRIAIGGKFLGLLQNSDPEDPIERRVLNEDEIDEYQANGIKVVVLDKLI